MYHEKEGEEGEDFERRKMPSSWWKREEGWKRGIISSCVLSPLSTCSLRTWNRWTFSSHEVGETRQGIEESGEKIDERNNFWMGRKKREDSFRRLFFSSSLVGTRDRIRDSLSERDSLLKYSSSGNRIYLSFYFVLHYNNRKKWEEG